MVITGSSSSSSSSKTHHRVDNKNKNDKNAAALGDDNNTKHFDSTTTIAGAAYAYACRRWMWMWMLPVAVAAIVLSVLSMLSCAFFSYRELTAEGESPDDNEMVLRGLQQPPPVAAAAAAADDWEESHAFYNYKYNPFEFFSQASVGLFRYSMGDPSGNGILREDPLCFSYCDEYSDYQWLSGTTGNPKHEETIWQQDHGSGNVRIDAWLVARYCSILAPSFGLVALMANTAGWRRIGITVAVAAWSVAAILQCGTFSVMLASPVLYSSSSSTSGEDEDHEQRFCGGTTNGRRCSLDAGGGCSLVSALAYALLAVGASALRGIGRNAGGGAAVLAAAIEHDTDESEDDDDDNDNVTNVGNASDGEEQHCHVHRVDSMVSCASC
eukprot:jgi/Psemu1/56866/gm1.56866_g